MKDKEKIWKWARGKETVTYKGFPIRLWADFSKTNKTTLQAKRGWKQVFQVTKGKDLHLRLLYPAKLSFRMEGQIKCFPDKVKLKESIITWPLLHEMLKGLMSEKKKIKNMNSKMTTNSQLLTTKPKQKQKQKQTNQTTRTGAESQKWRSHGGLSARRQRGEYGGKGTDSK